jgi:transposase InsO family protein
MVKENPARGAPRIHGELLKLGLCVPERIVSRYIRRLSPRGQARKLWATFLRNHGEVISVMDFFTVPTLTFRVLYCFFVIENGRRKIPHFNIMEHPTGSWIVQQFREAFPEGCPYRYAILDCDSRFGKEVIDLPTASGMKPKRISSACPWQNGVAERWIGSCPRELLDHVIIPNDFHLRRLIRDYFSDYRDKRTHDSFGSRQRCALFLLSRNHLLVWLHFRALVAYSTDMIGRRLPEEVTSVLQNPFVLEQCCIDTQTFLTKQESCNFSLLTGRQFFSFR